MIVCRQIFLKEWHRDALERQLKELNDRTAIIQKHYRGYVTRKKFRTLVLRARKYARIRLVRVRLEQVRSHTPRTRYCAGRSPGKPAMLVKVSVTAVVGTQTHPSC